MTCTVDLGHDLCPLFTVKLGEVYHRDFHACLQSARDRTSLGTVLALLDGEGGGHIPGGFNGRNGTNCDAPMVCVSSYLSFDFLRTLSHAQFGYQPKACIVVCDDLGRE